VTGVTFAPRLQEIVDDFAAVEGANRLQLLLEFSEELPGLPARYADDPGLLEPIPECQSPVFLAVEVGEDDAVHLFFSAPREAPTTRGFAGILHAGLNGMGADQVLATPAER
jgi:cysteine desulfuration protein SufE